MKRGQVTIFIILAVVIVLAIGIILFIQNRGADTGEELIAPEISHVHSFVENCIEDVGVESVFHIGRTGGYSQGAELAMEDTNVAYYLYERENKMPTKGRIEKEISRDVEALLYFCTKEFYDFHEEFNISYASPTVNTKIEDNWVVLNVDYPVELTKERKTYYFREFKDIKIPVRLGVIYDKIADFMEEQVTHPESICLGCVYDLAEKNNLYVRTYDYDNGVILYIVEDEQSTWGEEKFIYNFVNVYEEVTIW
jgi:hypothetical protein